MRLQDKVIIITGSTTGITNGFTATNFTYGGGSPGPNEGNLLTGNAYQKFGDLFLITGVPDEADIEGYELLAGASVGLIL